MTTGNTHVLPDSRLNDHEWGTVELDWQLPSGRVVRLACCPVHCVHCGRLGAYCPKDNCTFICWVCHRCFQDLGPVPGTFAVPEVDFNNAVMHEMERRYGHVLSCEELAIVIDQGKLSRELELLARESPYAVPSRGGQP